MRILYETEKLNNTYKYIKYPKFIKFIVTFNWLEQVSTLIHSIYLVLIGKIWICNIIIGNNVE